MATADAGVIMFGRATVMPSTTRPAELRETRLPDTVIGGPPSCIV